MTRKNPVVSPWLFSFVLLVAICLTAHASGQPKVFLSNVPKQGLFLVASENMTDPRFVQAVIFLVSVDESGTVGLMINHPSVYLLWDIIPSLKESEAGERQVYIGGPVGLNICTMLFRSPQPPQSSLRVIDDVYYSGDKRVVLDQARTASATVKILMGSAGWAPGQLEQEIEAGGWRLVSADSSIVFREETENLWQDLIQVAGMHWVQRGTGGSQKGA